LGKTLKKADATEIPSEIHVVVDCLAGYPTVAIAQINDHLIVAKII